MQQVQRLKVGASCGHFTRMPLAGSLCLLGGRRSRITVCAAKKGGSGSSSPWSAGPGPSKKSSSSNTKKSSRSSSKSGKSSQSSSSKAPAKTNDSSASSSVPSGVGFGAGKDQAKQTVVVHKLTPPLTPQLLDELSGWETCAAPLWSTFTGHCEGEWLGQYAAYTPWGGDPEPVWADDNGAQLLYAYSRASETRQAVPVSSSSNSDDFQTEGTASTAAAPADGDSDEELDMLIRSTVRSASIGSLIGGASAAAAAAAAAAERAGAATVSDSNAAADDESEGFAYNREGCIVFNGGSYSLGPDFIVAPEVEPDDWSSAVAAAAGDNGQIDPEHQEELYASLPHTTVVLEQCLVSSGDARLRLVATLKIRQPPGEQEIDVEVARLLLYKEHWYGTAESTSGSLVRKSRLLDRQSDTPAASSSSDSSSSSKVLKLLPSHKFDTPVISMSRPQPQQLTGRWNVFVVASNPVVEENPDTLQEEQVWVYSSREEQQQWHVPGITSSAALGSSLVASSSNGNPGEGPPAAAAVEALDDEGSGGSFWLPGGAVVTLRMVPIPQATTSSSNADLADDSGAGYGTPDSNGDGHTAGPSSKAARGLMLSLHWLIAEGSCEFIERQYDPDGQLFEVRHGSAVLGGWCGGRG